MHFPSKLASNDLPRENPLCALHCATNIVKKGKEPGRLYFSIWDASSDIILAKRKKNLSARPIHSASEQDVCTWLLMAKCMQSTSWKGSFTAGNSAVDLADAKDQLAQAHTCGWWAALTLMNCKKVGRVLFWNFSPIQRQNVQQKKNSLTGFRITI